MWKPRLQSAFCKSFQHIKSISSVYELFLDIQKGSSHTVETVENSAHWVLSVKREGTVVCHLDKVKTDVMSTTDVPRGKEVQKNTSVKICSRASG